MPKYRKQTYEEYRKEMDKRGGVSASRKEFKLIQKRLKAKYGDSQDFKPIRKKIAKKYGPKYKNIGTERIEKALTSVRSLTPKQIEKLRGKK